VYPALAVLQAIGKNRAEILWVGSQNSMEADLIRRAQLPFSPIPAGQIHGVGLKALAGIWQSIKGFFAARKIIQRFDPDVLFFTGGYVAVPVALAGRNIPTLLYVPDIEPGLALKVLARFADHIAVTTDDTLPFLPVHKKVTLTGYPIRPELSAWEPEKARQLFTIKPDLPVILISGGSLGARSINQALLPILPILLEHTQIIHISGSTTWKEVEKNQETLKPGVKENYHPFPYLHEEMGAALSIADLVVSRSGASSLGEYPLFGLPAVLVPYPYAWRYQKVNADFLVKHGAAILLEDSRLQTELLSTITGLLGDHERLRKMSVAMSSLAQPKAANHIANLILSLANGKKSEEGQ
jgi:UDP-N-acetylglucosamine--N-acetylmuramyl-(pentapeptide) pyrophosphoryl-undecaprenol N-acetylglucosamine transferase